MGKVEEEHIGLAVMWNQICERFLVLGAILMWIHVFMHAARWEFRRHTKLQRSCSWLWRPWIGKRSLLGMGGTVCHGRTSERSAGGLSGKEEMDLEVLNQGKRV